MAIDEADKKRLTWPDIDAAGIGDWRYVMGRLIARFDTGDFNTGAALVGQIAAAADEADHHPDVDLRYPHLTVSLVSHDVSSVTARDVRLARRISELAAEAGVSAAPAPDVLELAVDTADQAQLAPFYAALLGYDVKGDEVRDGADRSPAVWFQDTDSDAPDRQRWHVDIGVPHDAAQARIQAVLGAGGTLVDDSRAPAFWVVADPDGNRSCICTMESRD
jgi:4a-hydroxytetrahydrobiopterin dehydratase